MFLAGSDVSTSSAANLAIAAIQKAGIGGAVAGVALDIIVGALARTANARKKRSAERAAVNTLPEDAIIDYAAVVDTQPAWLAAFNAGTYMPGVGATKEEFGRLFYRLDAPAEYVPPMRSTMEGVNVDAGFLRGNESFLQQNKFGAPARPSPMPLSPGRARSKALLALRQAIPISVIWQKYVADEAAKLKKEAETPAPIIATTTAPAAVPVAPPTVVLPAPAPAEQIPGPLSLSPVFQPGLAPAPETGKKNFTLPLIGLGLLLLG